MNRLLLLLTSLVAILSVGCTHDTPEPTPEPTQGHTYESLTIDCDSPVAAGDGTPIALIADGSKPLFVEDAAFTVVPGTGTGYVSVSKGVAIFTGTTVGKVTIVATAGGVIGTKEVEVVEPQNTETQI
jgi:hypothetical protein